MTKTIKEYEGKLSHSLSEHRLLLCEENGNIIVHLAHTEDGWPGLFIKYDVGDKLKITIEKIEE